MTGPAGATGGGGEGGARALGPRFADGLVACLTPGSFVGLLEEEVELMSRVVTGMSGTGVEIGAMDGFSSAVILASSKLLLTSIDPFVRDSMDGTLIGSEARFRRNVGPWVSRSTLVRDYSHHVAGTWSSRIDFLFIDGDHNYAAVKRDYLDWTPWLREGGVLAMHDSRAYRGGLWHWPAPSAVAEEEIFSRPGHWDVIGEACSLTVARRT